MSINSGFLEVVIPIDETFELQERLDIEEILEELLESENIGEVSGGGAGAGVAIIDIDVFDESRTLEAVGIIVRVLREANVPHGTMIKQNQPTPVSYQVYSQA